ncbi:MAG: hypothetical protein M0Z95_20065 [Actinomycetota bacterium]|jgi:hypothetical protein|nr:hypothetical protein [Actinomycetota bacterium]
MSNEDGASPPQARLQVYAKPEEQAAIVARHLGLELTPKMPRPDSSGHYGTKVVMVVDTPVAAHQAAGLVGHQPIAAIVAWRLSAEAARTLFRLPIPVFHGAIDRDQFEAAMAGGWDTDARRLENEQMAELETNFVEAVAAEARPARD